MIVELSEARAWSCEVAQGGLEIRVVSGTAWVTQEGDPEDHVLEAGDAFLVDRDGRVAVQPLDRARIVVEAPHQLRAAAA